MVERPFRIREVTGSMPVFSSVSSFLISYQVPVPFPWGLLSVSDWKVYDELGSKSPEFLANLLVLLLPESAAWLLSRHS